MPEPELPPLPGYLRTDQPLLRSPFADGLSLLLFAAAGAFLAAPLVTPSAALPLAGGVALLGPLGCGIERGRARGPSVLQALACALAVGLAHGAALELMWIGAQGKASLAETGVPLSVGVVTLVAWPLPWLGMRFERAEEGWRAAFRAGPPTGGTPLAPAIVARLRGPGWLEALLRPLSWLLRLPCVFAILLYQLTASRLMPSACMYEPTCSRYGFQAFLHHGFLRGGLLTGIRVARCSPLGTSGYDPIPDPRLPTAPPETERAV